ncbi:acetyl esterase/lipase [Anseongella ginsenosidimutans]|uniref:Acetyl esterase/lipase n=1 Tax=Anseongella ginsenosidimutans TaxID=496056 RepID=A0A4R3KVW2_9SPHI|nr:acetyl esterase/lipase [Anseongella ginsenosidimutans]
MNFFLRTINKKRFLRERLAAGNTAFFHSPQPPSRIFKSCRVCTSQVNGRSVFTLSPRNKKESGTHILYLHGGAYVQNFVLFHWDFLAEMIRRTGCTITALDYPLAPDHTFKESFAAAEILYRRLTAVAYPRKLILMGDSSGGGFALALAQTMKKEHIAQPAQIILLSPWLDITLSNPRINDLGGMPPFLGIEGLRKAGALYAAGADPAHYQLSPINGSLEGLGKISIFIGTNDILLADAKKLKLMAGSKGIDISYYEYEGMFHAWMFLNFPEAKKAKQQIADIILLKAGEDPA